MYKNRRNFLGGLASLGVMNLVGCATQTTTRNNNEIFDAHCHIIDPRFPLIENQGYIPPAHPVTQYLTETMPLRISAGAIVSGSFQGYDQTYLREILQQLGPRWVGVTQVPESISDQEILSL